MVLRDLAQIHASFMENHNNILSSPWLEEMGREKMVSLRPLWLALLQHAANEFPQFWNKKWLVKLHFFKAFFFSLTIMSLNPKFPIPLFSI